MFTVQRLLFPLAVVAAAALAGCAAPGYYASPQAQYGRPPPGYPAAYASQGRVTNVELQRGGRSSTDGMAGTVIGGVVGGVIGNAFGGGTGRALLTAGGVVGGALLGRSIEQHANRGHADYYRVTVQFDDGSVRLFDYARPPDVRIGDRVRAEGDQLYR